MKKRTIFTFNIDNVVDIITNSSSELFVLKGETLSIVEEMVEETYPEYLTEYKNVSSMKDLNESDFDYYISYLYNTIARGEKGIKRYNAICGVEPKDLYSNWADLIDPNIDSSWPKFSDEGIKLLKKAIDPDENMYLMFSLDENPNWEKQEALMEIGRRHHLG